MGWRQEINWFAVHTKRFRERIAFACVSALGIEAFLPEAKVEPAPNIIIKTGSVPLFSGYFFARFNPELSLQAVEGRRGVLYVVKAGACPMPVDEQIVREIQDRIEPDGLIRLQPPELKAGDRVEIRDGVFAGLMGKVVAEPDDRRRVTILLEALWQARVQVAACGVEAQAA
jgi:transcription antitermination factor NusG